jgi:hypothetical protein
MNPGVFPSHQAAPMLQPVLRRRVFTNGPTSNSNAVFTFTPPVGVSWLTVTVIAGGGNGSNGGTGSAGNASSYGSLISATGGGGGTVGGDGANGTVSFAPSVLWLTSSYQEVPTFRTSVGIGTTGGARPVLAGQGGLGVEFPGGSGGAGTGIVPATTGPVTVTVGHANGGGGSPGAIAVEWVEMR